MSTAQRRWAPTVAAVTALALLVGWAPAGDDSGGPDTSAAATGDVTDPAELGEVTLTVWDQEVRGGQNEQIEALNAAFMEAYPNITIDRVSRSTDDLRTTLRLALSGDDAPDVVQANNSRSEMGQYVAAGLLVPLDEYAEGYGWSDRFPDSVRALASYSDDGAVYGEGQLYGLPQMGEIVGLFYNKTKLDELGVEPPATTDDFVAAVEAAQAAGETPVQFGNSEGWPGIHEYGFVQNQFVDAEIDPGPRLRPARLVVDVGGQPRRGRGDRVVGRLRGLRRWLQRRRLRHRLAELRPGRRRVLRRRHLARRRPRRGHGRRGGLCAHSRRRQRAEPGDWRDQHPVGDPGQRREPDAAAAYIDFITNSEAMTVVTEAGNLPVVDADAQQVEGLLAEVFTAWAQAGEEDLLVPYLDYATETFYDTITAAVQDLLAGQRSPQEFLEHLESEYSAAVGS